MKSSKECTSYSQVVTDLGGRGERSLSSPARWLPVVDDFAAEKEKYRSHSGKTIITGAKNAEIWC